MPPLAPRRDATGARILHIEDSPENRMLVRALLEPEGYTVVEAEDGLSGIEAALREVPDLVLLDLNLPGVDGYEVGVILRSFPTLAKTPIVAVTAYAMEGDRQRTLVAGCDGYIPKPIDPDVFPRQVEEFLRGKRERVEEREATPYLRELNQRLVYRLVHQVEELKRLNQQFVRRALQLEDLHGAMQDITSEVGVVPLLERLLPALVGALGMRSLTVELTDPPGVRVDARGRDRAGPAQGAEAPGAPGAAGEEREWRLPLTVRGRSLGVMIARHAPAPGVASDEEQLLKIVASQVAIAVENARLYQGTVERAAEAESLVEAGRLLASTLELSEVLHRLAEMVRRRLETDCVVRIWLREIGQPGEFCLHAQVGATREPPPRRVHVAAGEGLIGGIVYRRAPIVVDDLRSDPRVRNRERVREEGLASFLGVPMLLEDTPVGILTVATRERRVFSDGEVALVEALARSAAVAIWNAKLYEETQQQLSQTETLLRVSQAVGSTLDVAEVARRTTRELVRALGADMGGAWRLTPARDRLVPLAGYHVPRSQVEHLAGTPLPAASPLLAALRERGAPVFSSDSAGDPLFDDPLLCLLPHRSVLVVPMRIKDETTGGFAIVWTRERHEFRDEELRLAEGMVQQAAIAIENARLLEAEREARESLRVSETRYRELFENAMDLVYVHDLEGRILAFNEAGVRASGYTTGEILEMNIAQLMDAEDHARVRAVIDRMTRGECARELFTFELVRKNGTRAILECAARVIRRDGIPVAVQGVARDITERRKLEQRQAAFVEIVKELAAEDDFDRLFSLIGQRVCELVEADGAVISLVEGDDIVYRGSYGVDDPTLLTPRRRIAESRVGRVLAEKRAFACPDTAADPHWRDSVVVQRLGYRALIDVPIILRGEVIGVLGVLHRAPRAFSEEDVALLTSLAEHTAVAYDRTNLLRKLEARLRETETLLAVTQALSSTLDPTETMRRVAREITRALGADMVGAYLADAAKETLHPIAGYRVPEELYERFMRYPIPIQGHPAMEEAWQQRKTVWWSDAARDGRLDPGSVQRFPHQSALFVPMTVKDEPIGGFFVVWWKERRQFTPEEVRLVAGISDQAAMFIENARLYSEATRRRREAEELARLARMLTESLDAADVGERIVESSLQLLGGRFSVLRLLQPDGMLKLIASKGDPRVLGRLLPLIPSGVGVVGRAAASGAPAWSADVFADAVDLPEDMRAHIEELGLRAYLAVPLRVKREIIGVIGVGDETGRHFSDAEVALLQTFADQAAIALENSRLYGDLRAALRAVEESQQRIVQGERLRALGEMAGGVAHDFNNVLAIIVGRAEVLLNETEDPELQRQLNVIIKVALDAAQTVKRIQEFTRMRRARPFQPVHVHQLVDEVVEVTRSRWKDEAQSRGIRYDVVVEANPTPAILGDPSEIREALTNILFNAFDAMPDGGRVTLRTGVEGDRVFCSIEDTGIGMSEDVRQRIFDPFFTTKGERGTGLGLSVVYGIVTRHTGELDVRSRLGAGTTFVIRFPVAGEAAVEQPVRRPRQSHARARGRILVIDDERDVADILGDVLTRDGHQVAVCSDGAAGLARFEREEFDLVITDLGMPGMSGWEVARLVKLARPGVPVVMITGWGDRIDPAEAVSRGVDVLISKPFKRDQIREVVNAALGEAPAPTARPGQPPPLRVD
jgi:PAS domain S-box-containing protein